MRKMVITCAVCGAETTKEHNPNLPVTPMEIAESTCHAYKAGASIVHLHVRDKNGKATMDVDIFSETIKLIREKCDIVVEVTTGGGVGMSDEERMQVLELKPEMASLDCGTVNFGDEFIVNTLPSMKAYAKKMQEYRIRPTLECFDLSHIYAAETLIKELDEDFLEYLGTNPLTDAIDIFLEGDYVEMAFLETFKTRLADENIVHEILIDEDLAEQVYSNLQRISLFLLFGVALLTVISFFLINSSIQLAIYSRRFIIKTMQLVGATRGFIRSPFLRTGSLHGVLGAIFATSLLYLSLYYINIWIPELEIHQQWNFLALVPVGLLMIGIGISWICTYFAVRKYLNLKTDDLYY